MDRPLDLDALYAGLPSGFDASAVDRDAVDRVAGEGAAVYGELLDDAARRLLTWLRPGPDDRLWDIGSGTGRLVIQAAWGTDVGGAYGVELSAERHAVAVAAPEETGRGRSEVL